MTTYAPFDRDQPFLLPPDLKDWLPEDDLAHFIVAAAERVRLGAFCTNRQAGGKPQYHPRLMLALLVYCYANGVFSSRRIERAAYRDIRARFIAAKDTLKKAENATVWIVKPLILRDSESAAPNFSVFP
jgi:transposase